MKLKMLYEGWSLDLGEIPTADLIAAMKDRKSLTQFLGDTESRRDKSAFRYREKDYKSDFIRVVPFNKSKSLASHHDKNALTSFSDAKIMYGFCFITKTSDFQDTHTTPLQDDKAEAETIRQHAAALDAAISDKDSRKQFRRGTNMINPLTGEPYDIYGSEQNQIQMLQTWRDKMEKHAKAVDARKSKPQTTGGHTGVANKTAYLNSLKYAFASALKHPTTPQGIAVRNNFIEFAADNFGKQQAGNYDYILYPESSSNFNTILAKAIARRTGGVVLQGFKKLPIKDIEIDSDALQARYTGDNGEETDADREERKLRGAIAKRSRDNRLSIKDIPMADKRRYIKMWKATHQGKGSVNFAHKRILVVDDNVVQSGTMERIHQVINNLRPARIDIYTPLYMGESLPQPA